MTRRERLERKVERRREWADKAAARSESAFARVDSIARNIPLGQPILVGHHSERHHRRDIERIDNGMRKGVENAKLADHHTSKAGGLADQLASSIFSDDPDAPEALAARIAELETKRSGYKQANKAYKTGATPADGIKAIGNLLGAEWAAEATRNLTACPYYKVPFPPYCLSNIGGNILRLKKRVEEIRRRASNRQAAAEAGGCLIIGKADYVNVVFAEKPDRAILDALRAAGFHWSGSCWCGYREKLPAEVLALVSAPVA